MSSQILGWGLFLFSEIPSYFPSPMHPFVGGGGGGCRERLSSYKMKPYPHLPVKGQAWGSRALGSELQAASPVDPHALSDHWKGTHFVPAFQPQTFYVPSHLLQRQPLLGPVQS